MTLVVEAAGLTDVGMKRKGNEDSFAIVGDQHLYVVADGMGGHQAGEVASRIVVDTMCDYMARFAQDDNAEELSVCDESLSVGANRLLASIHMANRSVYEIGSKKKAYQGMGSTVSAVYLTDDTFIAANVGDSPIYLIHDGTIEEVSVPHTVIQEQMAIDPTAANRMADKFSHMLTRAMGVEANVEPDVCEVQCFKGDCLLLCSDGLSNKVSPEEILEVLENQRPEKACRTLVDMANERGGEDNITVIAIQVKTLKETSFSRFMTRIFGRSSK